MPSAYLLVSHGSRDPRPQVSMDQLVRILSQSQTRTHNRQITEKTAAKVSRAREETLIATSYSLLPTRVGAACLELSSLPLHEQIAEFSDRVLEEGYNRLQIVPLFLLPGVHVMEDIPSEVALAQQVLGQKLKLEIRPHLGTHQSLTYLLARQLAMTKAEAWILLAHGSRRAGSSQPVEATAKQLKALSAYWAVAPSLQLRVQELARSGHHKIGVIPYFLFAGGITDAIAQRVEQLQEQYSSISLYLAEPIGASQELADLILDLVD